MRTFRWRPAQIGATLLHMSGRKTITLGKTASRPAEGRRIKTIGTTGKTADLSSPSEAEKRRQRAENLRRNGRKP